MQVAQDERRHRPGPRKCSRSAAASASRISGSTSEALWSGGRASMSAVWWLSPPVRVGDPWPPPPPPSPPGRRRAGRPRRRKEQRASCRFAIPARARRGSRAPRPWRARRAAHPCPPRREAPARGPARRGRRRRRWAGKLAADAAEPAGPDGADPRACASRRGCRPRGGARLR